MKNKEPSIAFIIPAKNEAEYIGHCLQGLKSLNYDSQKIEVLVVDNGSSDSTAEIAITMGCRVLSSDASSISALRNIGAANTSGQILGFIDADCIVEPTWIKTALVHFAAVENLCAVGVPEAPPRVGSTWVEETWTHLKHGNTPLLGFSYTTWCASGALLIKRAIFEEVGGFDTKLATCEDADLGKRVSMLGSIILDYRVPFQHLRGSRTLMELFKREMWRGQGNIAGFLGHGMSWKELPSVLVPLIFIFCLLLGGISIIVALWIPEIKYSQIFFFGVVVSLPYLMILKKIGPPATFQSAWKAYLVCFVYLLARGFGSIFSGSRTW